jgi:GMP synthase-like glutamine amidotransferase
MRVTVVRHHEEDSAGFIGDAFASRGAELGVHLFPKEGPLPEPEGLDHVVLLGANFSVYSGGPDADWIAEELAWLRRADEACVPVFGICFGAQALAAAFGGRVGRAARQEPGWTVVDTLDPALIPAGPWLEFHGDRCYPPPQARLLARNPLGVQAFALGRHLAVQFHPEVDEAQLRGWLDAGGRAEAERAGVDPDRFLADTAAEEPAARDRAERLVATALRIAAASVAAGEPGRAARGVGP